MYVMKLTKLNLVYLCFFLINQFVYAQLSEKQILNIVASEDLQTARARLEAIAKHYPSSPDVIYLQSLLTENGEKALKNYTQLYSHNKSSRYAPDIIYKIAQFNYAKGDYNRARIFFSHIVLDYPNSELTTKAQYFAAKMVLALSKFEQAKEELKDVLKEAKDQEIAALAREDLLYIEQLSTMEEAKKDETQENREEQEPVQEQNNVRYAVQIGAFGSKENAISQRDYYARLGYAAEILVLKTRNGLLYRVILGRFATELEARRFGKQINSLHNIKYRILKTSMN
ncbi:MAG: SPOR domain-containing protein [Deferribacteres bacterium]|nr:SPOR domain-containing protein [candidate division KSB1 bacterium]MCB9502397.1 SPOR domain-containing protein [Deferribacteres bacterium]